MCINPLSPDLEAKMCKSTDKIVNDKKTVTLPRHSSLSKCPTVSWYTSKCNFFYMHKKNTALSHPVLTKVTHLNIPVTQNFNQIGH